MTTPTRRSFSKFPGDVFFRTFTTFSNHLYGLHRLLFFFSSVLATLRNTADSDVYHFISIRFLECIFLFIGILWLTGAIADFLNILRIEYRLVVVGRSRSCDGEGEEASEGRLGARGQSCDGR